MPKGEKPKMAETTPRTRVVYGDAGECLVFIEEGAAHDFVRLHRALEAGTWGEFRARAPAHWYEDAVGRLEEQAMEELHADEGPDPVGGRTFEEPAAEKRFDADEIPGHTDSDWPGWPQGDMGSWMPDEVRRRFGKVVSNFSFGDFLQLPPEHEDEIVSVMRDHGYDCVRDDDLVWAACYGG